MIFVTATDTNVGKTYTSAKILKTLSKELGPENIAYYKVIQCGVDPDTKQSDLDVIKEACPDIDLHCSYFFDYPATPQLAAEMEGVTVDMDQIMADFEEIEGAYDFILVEGAGGLAVPVANAVLVSDIAAAFDLPTMIVTRPDLGTLNHTLLSVEHALSKGLELMPIMMSNYPSSENIPELIRTAPQIISNFTELEVYTSHDEYIRNEIIDMMSVRS